MWSQRAEEVVRRLIAALPPSRNGSGTHAERLSALPIGFDLWSERYLRPNGEVVIVGEDLEKPDEDTAYSDRLHVLTALVWGSERYPELRELIPEPGPDVSDCSCLIRPDLFGPGKIICGTCGGVGWLETGTGLS